MRFRSIFEQALIHENGIQWLHEQLIKLRSEGVARETLLSELWEFHNQLENETDQDFIKDILDIFYGWCSPHWCID